MLRLASALEQATLALNARLGTIFIYIGKKERKRLKHLGKSIINKEELYIYIYITLEPEIIIKTNKCLYKILKYFIANYLIIYEGNTCTNWTLITTDSRNIFIIL